MVSSRRRSGRRSWGAWSRCSSGKAPRQPRPVSRWSPPSPRKLHDRATLTGRAPAHTLKLMDAKTELSPADADVLPSPLVFTDAAARKVADLIRGEGNPRLMLRVFVQGEIGRASCRERV